MGLTNNNNINYENVTMISCLGPTVSGQSVSISGSVGSPSTTRSEAPSIHLNDDDDDAGSQAPPDVGTKKKKRGQGQGQRATGGAKNGRGLRQFSLKVCEKVESKGTTTYNEVADELVAEFSEPINGVQAPDQQQYDEKNIRRRVYDALNVLMAMDIISKDKKEIHWRGLPRTSFNNVEVLKRDQLALRNRFEKKSAYLRELQDQYVGLQNLIQRNEQLYRSGNAPSSGVALPFILVQTRPHATVEVEISEDMQLVHFDFNSTPFEIHDDNHVLKAMKLCNQSEGGDNNGGACSSLSTECQPRVPLPSKTTIPSARPPTSPSFPGILAANAKLEH